MYNMYTNASNIFYSYTRVSSYSLHFRMKVMFGHKLHYEVKVTFGEISLKLRQPNWNVARNNANSVAYELPSQITVCTCLTIDFGLDGVNAHQRDFMRFGTIPPKWQASNAIGTKSFRLYYGHP
jgi:hypothetical protein